MTSADTYNTIKDSAQGEVFKDKGSKFLAYAFPVENEDQIKNKILYLKEITYSIFIMKFPKMTLKATISNS